MSIAIAPTLNTMGVRRLSGYAIQPVWRGPAEPGPRAANHVVTGMAGYGLGNGNGTAAPRSVPIPSGARPTNDVRHVILDAEASQPGTSSMPSQSPTGSIVSSYSELSAQIAPSVAQTISPAANPTSVATVASAAQPGYVVVSSGAAASPDYVSDIEAWLTSTSLLATIDPSIAIPNWIPALAIGGIFAMIMTRGKK